MTEAILENRPEGQLKEWGDINWCHTRKVEFTRSDISFPKAWSVEKAKKLTEADEKMPQQFITEH